MSTVYILEQGTKVEKKSKLLIVKKDEKVLLEIPEFKVERVFIFGNVQLTTQAIKFLLESGIDTAFFTIYGKLVGKLISIDSKNIMLRLAQYKAFNNEEFKLLIAKNIVEGKIKNMRTVLQKYNRNHPETNFSDLINELENYINELKYKTRISTVIGIEGCASATYFKAFGKMFRRELQFTVRSKRPPKDPINALLSLGYMLITSEMFSIVSAMGFDPYLGFLHSVEYGRQSLALDLIEEFRQVVIDRLTLEIINKEILKEEDFEEKEGGIYLKEDSMRKYFEHYERRMLTSFQDEDGNEINFRKMFLKQAQKFAKSIQSGISYTTFTIK